MSSLEPTNKAKLNQIDSAVEELPQSVQSVAGRNPGLIDYDQLGEGREPELEVREALERARGQLVLDPLESPLLDIKKTKRLITLGRDAGELLEQLIDNRQPLLVDSSSLSTEPKLREKLLDLEHRSKLYLDERGAAGLFLDVASIKLEDGREAPLLHVPMRIERDEKAGDFRLEFAEQGIVFNPALLDLLGAKVPEPAAPNQFQLEAFLREFRTNYPDAQIDPRRAVLASHSLGGYSISSDLDPDRWPEQRKPWNHPIVRSMLVDGFYDQGQSIPSSEIVDDHIDPQSSFDVMSTDSSQIRVINEARRGKSLVVAGPPGTGKSTTIVNMIANAVADGKKVLVLSEKADALNVVERWLKRFGLGDTSLNLQGERLQTGQVLKDVKSTLELGRPVEIPRDPAVRKLGLAQQHLNDVTKLLSNQVRESGFSGYEVLSELLLSSSQKQELLDLSVPEMRRWNGNQYKQALELVQALEQHISAHGLPASHPFYGTSVTKETMPEQHALEASLTEVHEAAVTARGLLEDVFGKLGLNTNQSPESARELSGLLMHISEYYSDNGEFFRDVDFSNPAFRDEKHALSEVLIAGKQFFQLRNDLKDTIKPRAWEVPRLAKLHTILMEEVRAGAVTKPKGKNGKLAVELVEELCLPGKAPTTFRDMASLVDKTIQIKRSLVLLEHSKHTWAKLLGERWVPSESKDDLFWHRLQFVIDFTTDFVERAHKHPEFDKLVSLIKEPSELYETDSNQAFENLYSALDRFTNARADLLKLLRFRPEVAERVFDAKPISEQEHILSGWRFNSGRLRDLTGLNQLIEASNVPGKESILARAESWPHASHRLVDSLRNSWFSGLGQDFLTFTPLVGDFQSALHEDYIREFCEADSRLLQQNAVAVSAKHWQGMPRLDAGGQFSALLSELKKDRDQQPLSELMAHAGSAIQSIKPVFLMSPQAVAENLPREGVHFDLLIVDEGSQLRPVKALGSILRADQVVVFGDSKQLPPSRDLETWDTPVEEGETEDIIKALTRAGAPKRSLEWHYRSLRESLMSVANSEFYDGILTTFPDAERGREALGPRVHFVPHGKLDSAQSESNLLEAKRTGELVAEHIKSNPTQSLGVIAVSEQQAQAIRSEIERLRESDSEIDTYLKQAQLEPFFVKTIDTVQGDERDRIIISLGFGRGHDGELSANFGALSAADAEKRLNVMLTRARSSCEIISSIQPEQIDLTKSNHDAVRVLKNYLIFARDGVLEQPEGASSGIADPFEQVIKDGLEERGYTVETNIGLSSVKIDLAVVDPDDPSRFIMGIMTDGHDQQAFHSARERERIIPEELRQRGWNLHRTWIIDWFKRPEEEMQKLVSSIEAARGQRRESLQVGDDLPSYNIKREARVINPLRNSGLIVPYQKARIRFNSDQVLNEKNVTFSQLKVALADVVNQEGPIHRDEAFKRLRMALGVRRAGSELTQKFALAEHEARTEGLIRESAGFLYPIDGRPMRIRDRSELGGSLSEITKIAPEELDVALLTVVKHACGIERSAAIEEATKLLGLRGVPEFADSVIGARLDELLESNLIRSRDHQLVLAQSL